MNDALLPQDANGRRICELFGSYLWQVIVAPAPQDASQKPQWHTITHYPIRPRILWERWQDAGQLVGVRFGQSTHYALLDIDTGSTWHSPEGIAQLRAGLETLGITRTVLIRSSWSGGLHLYLPLPESVHTFSLAVALQEGLQSQGFTLKAGQLEVFPNVKTYGVNIFVEYNAHRLPLQPASGSFMLDDDFNPVSQSLSSFFLMWDQAAAAQDIDLLRQALVAGRNVRRKHPRRPRLSQVEAWQTDMAAEINEGWTGAGQTNHLLKSIACYGRVFEGLWGEELVSYIIRIASNCPGYEQYCRHQHDLRTRAIAWARAAEKYYWPLGSLPQAKAELQPSTLAGFNRQQAEDARQRIQRAYNQLQQTGELPQQITARAKAIAQIASVSQQTLYKNLPLWHPYHQGEINEVTSLAAAEPGLSATPTEPPQSLEIKELHPAEGIMKCKSPLQGEVGSDPNFISSERGVRGENSRFPQPLHSTQTLPLPLTGTKPLNTMGALCEGINPADADTTSTVTSKAASKSMPPVCAPDSLDVETNTIIPAIQRCIQRLQWNYDQVKTFIDQHFHKSRTALSLEELESLLYRLQTKCLDPPKPQAR
jgi:hypothetical protein